MANSSRKILFWAAIVLLILGGYYWMSGDLGLGEEQAILIEVQKGDLTIQVRATGELQAKNSKQIQAPAAMRTAGVNRTQISDMVPEGTVVNEGDYVATLDRTEISNKIQAAISEIDRINNQLVQLQIDTAIEMQGLRDQLLNQQFILEERQLQMAQSKYEPQMIIRQAEIDLQRAERDYNQMIARYDLKQEQAEARIAEVNSTLRQEQFKLDNLRKLSEDFTILSPGPGMIIYQRNWSGRKGPGSEITPWDLTVAELPDLSEFISLTYVNEIDISRVSVGQEVEVTVDAFPENIYRGIVTEVANIGQQLRNQDARVFEVTIELQEADDLLRPAMTTGNRIKVASIQDVLLLPLEALYRDSVDYVVANINSRKHRQEIIRAESNNIHFEVKAGLEKGQQLYLGFSGDHSELPIKFLDAEVKKEALERLAARRAEMDAERKRIGDKQRERNTERNRVESAGSVIIIN
ncbi:MAG: HlyD family efflux transporter periplasmic adaptor subunit [Saprospirales bacterium]|nr:MAG: HlyD family efflux transporter periplasmic adaptor subunit [Saprospirales bacterium]